MAVAKAKTHRVATSTDIGFVGQVLHQHAALGERCVRRAVELTADKFGIFVCASGRRFNGYDAVSTQVQSFVSGARALGVRRIVTGGGPFCMEVANRAAAEAGLISLEVPIGLPSEHAHKTGGYDSDVMWAHSIPSRVALMSGMTDITVCFAGGFGTLDEATSIMVRSQLQRDFSDTGTAFHPRAHNGRSLAPPTIMIGKIWRGLRILLEDMVDAGTIKADDLALARFVEDADGALEIVQEFKVEWDRALAAGKVGTEDTTTEA